MAEHAAAILAVATLIPGWLLVTAGVAALTSPQVWPISIGLLLISCGGWRGFLGFLMDGLFDA